MENLSTPKPYIARILEPPPKPKGLERHPCRGKPRALVRWELFLRVGLGMKNFGFEGLGFKNLRFRALRARGFVS